MLKGTQDICALDLSSAGHFVMLLSGVCVHMYRVALMLTEGGGRVA